MTSMKQAAWLLKCRALTKKSWIDDLEIEEEGVADILMGKVFLEYIYYR